MSEKTALIVIMNGVEELEAFAPVDCLRRAGVTVTIAANRESRRITGKNGIVFEADVLLPQVLGESYDLVIIPGGPGHAELVDDEAVLTLLREQNRKGGLIGSICAGPVVLQNAGILTGKVFTSFPATENVLPDRIGSVKVVQDGHVITAQGAGCAINFALKLVEALLGSGERRKLAGSICC